MSQVMTADISWLHPTPLSPKLNKKNTQDMLGWMLENRTLQQETFPFFTVLTNRRDLAEILILLVGLMEYVDQNKLPSSPNLFFRNFELLWAICKLNNDGEESLERRFMNIERFQEYWRSTSKQQSFKIAGDNRANYLRNLGYGVAPHYWAALTKWGLINKNTRGYPELTEYGKQAYKNYLRPFKRDRNNKISEILNLWFSGKSVNSKQLKDISSKLIPKTNTCDFWWKMADIKAGDVRSPFSVIWQILREKIHPKNIQSFKEELDKFAKQNLKSNSNFHFTTGEVLRRWVINQLKVNHNLASSDIDRLQKHFKRCREAEIIGGTATFLLSLMVSQIQPDKPRTYKDLAESFKPWLSGVQNEFILFLKKTDPDSIFRQAFGLLNEKTSSRNFLRSIVGRHLREKPNQQLLIEIKDSLERTEENPPNLDSKILWKHLCCDRRLILPKIELASDPEDPWKIFTESDFHWDRFASWMRISEETVGSENDLQGADE